MSNTVQGLVSDNAPLSGDCYHVLLALADEANDDGYAYISNPKLARKARVSLRNTIYAVQFLEKKKIGDTGETLLKVIRHKQKGLSNDYFINLGLLGALPYYWPPALVKTLGEDRVQRLHPKRRKTPVENSPRLGANVEKNGVQNDGLRVQNDANRVQRLHPSHVMSPMTKTPGQDSPVSHDRPDPVENFFEDEQPEQQSLFGGVENARLLVQDVPGDGALPKGGRWVRGEMTDPGGWSSYEVLAAYKEMVPRPPSDKDKRNLEQIAGLKFSTQLTIYLMQAAKRKAKEPPGSMNYFLTALSKLAVDIQYALRDADEATWQMTPQQTYWYRNSIVEREITMWERWLGRS